MKLLLDPRTLLEYLVHRNDKFEYLSEILKVDSSDEVPTPSTDELSPQSTRSPLLKQIIADSLLNRFAYARSTAQADILKYDELVTACRTSKNHLDIGKESINRLNISVAKVSEIQRSLVHRLSIKPPLTQLIAHPDTVKFETLAASTQVTDSPLVNRVPEPLVARSAGKIEFVKSDIPIDVIKSSKNPFDDLVKGAIQDGKAYSSSVDRSSIKPIVAQSAVAKLSRLEAERLTCKSATDTFFQNIDRANQINPLLNMERSYSDRSGLFSQIKLLESMQNANTIESYLYRKN